MMLSALIQKFYTCDNYFIKINEDEFYMNFYAYISRMYKSLCYLYCERDKIVQYE